MPQPLLKKRALLQVYHKILLAFFVAVLIIYAIGLAINIRLEHEIQNSLLSSISAKETYLSLELLSGLEHIQSLCNYTVIRFSVRKLVLYNKSNTIGDMLEEIRLTREILSSITSSSGLAASAAVILPELGVKITSYSYSDPLEDPDYDLLSAYASGGREGNSLLIWNGGLYFISPIYSPNDQYNDYPAALVVELSGAAIAESIAVAADSGQFDLAVLVDETLVIGAGSPSEDLSAEALLEASRIPYDSQLLYRNTLRLDGKDYWVVHNRLDKYPIEIVALADVQALTRQINQPQTWSILFSAIAGLAFLCFLIIVNHLITRPFRKFAESLNQLKHDEILQLEYNGNEFNAIYQAFNELTARLKVSIEQVYDQKMIVHRAEMKYLQAQINPHFLYNSFFHLYRMSKMEDLEGVAEMSSKLGRYYQYITRSASATVPLVQEYENARDYTDIQTIRFGTRITVIFGDLPEAYRRIPVPKFILQPILENAYNHGLDQITSKGVIRVTAEADDEWVVLAVEDNGGDIGPEELQKISRYLKDSDPEGEITGLRNTRIRLSAYGGELRVDASEMGGMKVILTIPVRREE